MLWKGLGLRREKTVTWPLGYGSVVRWSGGSKIYLDLENDGRRLIRLKAVSGTDNLVDIKVRYARSVRRYRLLVRGLGEEKYLGLPIRYITTRVFPLRYTRACHLEGTFKGRRFALIDDDVNGNYDDFGRDMIRFESGRVQPLSRVLNVDGTLYSLGRVKADGSKILFEEYVGDSGILRVDWKGNGRRKPAILVFQCVQGEFTPSYFNLAGGEPLRIPNGHYRFMHGIITEGKGRKRRFVLIGSGKSEVFEVERDQTVVKAMGAPFDVRAAVTRAEDGVQIPGSRIKIYGTMKEEYHHFYPDSFRPRISVRIADGPAVAMEERPGRPGKAEADRFGRDVMWFPKNFEFGGDTCKKYQVKVDIEDDLLGAIRGNWNEAPVILKHP
jgi:hypothetical protein